VSLGDLRRIKIPEQAIGPQAYFDVLELTLLEDRPKYMTLSSTLRASEENGDKLATPMSVIKPSL
jgi:hypothetical protein